MAAFSLDKIRRESLSRCLTPMSIPSGELNRKEMEQLLIESFYNPEVLKVISDAINSYLYLTDDTAIPSLKFRHFFTELQKIGGKSSFGTALLASSNELRVVIKTPLESPENHETIIHETFVGVCELNKLRDECANFAYVLGGLFCNPVMIRDDIGGFCTIPGKEGKGNVPYVIYEEVKRSITLERFFSTEHTIRECLEVVIQIILALQLAYQKCDFTHFDLHNLNILVQERSDFFVLRYGKYYLKTKHVAVIIDYGVSHVKHNGIDVYSPVQACKEVDYTKSHPYFDIHLFLGIVAFSIRKYPNLIYLADFMANTLMVLEGHPAEGHPFEGLGFLAQSTKDNRLRLPHDPKYDTITHQQIIDVFIAKYPDLLTEIEPESPFQFYCADDLCETRDEIIDLIIEHPPIPDCYDYAEVIDLVNSGYKGKINVASTIAFDNERTMENLITQAKLQVRQLSILSQQSVKDYESIAVAHFLLAEQTYIAFYRDLVGQIFEKRAPLLIDDTIAAEINLAKYLPLVQEATKSIDKKIKDMGWKAIVNYERFQRKSELEGLLKETLGEMF